MKLSTLLLNRRSNNIKEPSPFESTGDVTGKSPVSTLWLFLHASFCVISLALGFRLSRIFFLFLFSASSTNFYTVPFDAGEISVPLRVHSSVTITPIVNVENPVKKEAVTGGSRVVVGRHGIRIRSWPHPNQDEVMKAHRILESVQTEQRALFGVKNPRTVIAVTPTYVRTFQKLHLIGVMHSLMLVPYDLVWIVVEAGGVTNETASIVVNSGLRTIHIGFNQRIPISWDARHKLESRMRLHALRIVRKENLDGIVMFADDSNMHSMELFDEIQSVKWIGAVSVGILVQSDTDESSSSLKEEASPMPVQGPACNATNHLVGLHTYDSLKYAKRSAFYIGDRAPVLPRKLEWSGFVLNSRLLWKDLDDKPDWIKDINALDGADEDIDSPLSLLKDTSVLEPLGSCGRQVLLWWLRVEARTDSKFPPQWIIDHPLDISVPSKHTPWPIAPPGIPIKEKVLTGIQEQTSTRHSSTKTRTSRSRRSRSKKKHDTKVIGVQASTHSDQN
ncbi:Beta-1,4-xylosyltransferase irx14 [Trifolium repens]|nr:Beta-1,4-xylosyltransferase irx14 [Trifolium repens]